MNKLLLIIIPLLMLISGIAFAVNQDGQIKGGIMDKKILIAYFSWSGNTKAAAEKIKSVTGGDLFEIKTKESYPKEYNTVVNLVKKQKENNILPELTDNGDIKNYDIIFIGTPVWWYTASPPVKTFLAENDFSGKILIPFCTHGGGGASSTYTDIQKAALNAEVLEGYTSYENTAKIDDIKKWINDLNI